MKALVWLRRDLRVCDNSALYNAVNDCGACHAVFFVTPLQWQVHSESPAKLAFWRSCLHVLQKHLEKLGIGLTFLAAPSFAEIPAQMLHFCRQFHFDRVYFNNEYEYNERARDQEVTAVLAGNGIVIRRFDDRVLLPPGQVLTAEKKYYTVFSPFKKAWLKRAAVEDLKPLPVPAASAGCDVIGGDIEKVWAAAGSWRDDLWPAGEESARQMLQKFAAGRVSGYHQNRDFPGTNGTSLLSPYLAAGVVSPRQCLQAITNGRSEWPEIGSGPESWLNELIWRDFYYHVMVGFERVSRGQPFKTLTNKLQWSYDQEKLEKWQNGLTGFPIVDAAMRQLKQTGWMHNRLRMVAAMFLSKYLFIDWRSGEKFFMENLLDGDLAANNGGWQWSASTGTDSVPYFRIFNPFSQSARFDAEGAFIRKFCPELAELPDTALHDPKKLAAAIMQKKINYPTPLVDTAKARQQVLTAFSAL